MARPTKDGFDYFPLNTTFDSQFQAIENLFGNDGFTWIIKFWQEAYKNNNGFVNLNGLLGIIQAKNCRITPEKQQEIISACLELGLITEKEDKIYTSEGIQKRIKKIVGEREYGRNYAKNELLVSKLPNKDLKRGEIEIEIEIEENIIQRVYDLYPSRDENNKNRSTGKCGKDKIKISKLLKEGKNLEKLITDYIQDCNKTKTYIKNFSVFLNNLPEIEPIKNTPKPIWKFS